eukprot:10585588-Alexandrium_andersonii.AAC.1
MSASLVGSEMCIRDSLPRAPAVCRANGKSRFTRAWMPLTPQPATRRPPPVSYTHLTLPTICSV